MQTIHLVCRPAGGGIKTHIAGLLSDLPTHGWKLVLHAPQALCASLSEFQDTTDFRPIEIGSSVSLRDFPLGLRLAHEFESGAVVHAHGLQAAWICVLAKLTSSFRLVVTLHNVPPQGAASSIFLWLITALSYRLICVSDFIRRPLTTEKAITIPNGVLCDGQPNRSTTPERPFTVFCASRLSTEKGVDLLIDVAKRLRDVRFVIAGDGPAKAELVFSAPDNVTFLGRRNDVSDLMAAADCVVVPSRTEGQGIAVLEGFAAGAPVVATRVGGIPENLIHDKTGLLIDPENVNQIVSSIERLQKDRDFARLLASNALQWVCKARNRQSQNSLVAAVYTEVTSVD